MIRQSGIKNLRTLRSAKAYFHRFEGGPNAKELNYWQLPKVHQRRWKLLKEAVTARGSSAIPGLTNSRRDRKKKTIDEGKSKVRDKKEEREREKDCKRKERCERRCKSLGGRAVVARRDKRREEREVERRVVGEG